MTEKGDYIHHLDGFFGKYATVATMWEELVDSVRTSRKLFHFVVLHWERK